MGKRLIIIDANALIHRAYHALPKLTTKKGEPVGAIYGFLLLFFRAVKEFTPDFICACFDLPQPTFRHRAFKEYKAQRPKTPEELVEQIAGVKEFLKVLQVPIFEKEGFEADDLLATIASKVKIQKSKIKNKDEKVETIILSGDLDTLQLVGPHTKVYTLRRGIRDTVLYDEREVRRRFGFEPEKLPDFKALKGDSSDNIPGVPGIGEKTATELIREFGSLEKLYDEIQQPFSRIPPAVRAKLLEYQEQAFFSKTLAQTRPDVEIDFDLAPARWGQYDHKQARQLLEKYEFYSLLERLPGTKPEGGTLFEFLL